MTFPLLHSVASLKQQLTSIRAALDSEVLNIRNMVRSVAISCGNEDRSDATLLRVGLELRRGRSHH